jgi:hypothetical protein
MLPSLLYVKHGNQVQYICNVPNFRTWPFASILECPPLRRLWGLRGHRSPSAALSAIRLIDPARVIDGRSAAAALDRLRRAHLGDVGSRIRDFNT